MRKTHHTNQFFALRNLFFSSTQKLLLLKLKSQQTNSREIQTPSGIWDAHLKEAAALEELKFL